MLQENPPELITGTTMSAQDTKSALRDMQRYLEVLTEQELSVRQTRAFLLVATEEGLGVNEYAERMGVAQSVMTRLLLDIGLQTRKREPGLGLVTQRPDPLDMRKHQAHLTPKGKALLHKLLRVWE